MMQNLNWINKQKKINRSVALGTFDGVHRGHRQLLQTAINLCPPEGSSCVLTFDKPPEQYFRGEMSLLTSFSRKVELIQKMGIQEIAWLPFSSSLAAWSAHEFVERLLVQELRVKQVICGFNHHFGRERQGDVDFLLNKGAKFGFEVTVVPPVLDQYGQAVSSTIIRQLIAEGKIKTATHYLGYYPLYEGTVIPGAARGRLLGFPTANLQIDPRLVLPGEGVYLTWCILENQQGLPSLTSIGRNPTFTGKRRTIETFILDFSGDLYEQNLKLQFLEHLRNIIHFQDSESLKAQIQTDLNHAKQLITGFHLQDGQIVLK